MATANVAYGFATDTEGWLSCEWIEAGLVRGEHYLELDAHSTEEAIELGGMGTWQTWGVPSGATVTSVEITRIRTLCNDAASVFISPVKLRSDVRSIADLTDQFSVTTWYTNLSHAAVTISESSDDPVEMIIPFDLYGIDRIYQFDFAAIEFTVTYDASPVPTWVSPADTADAAPGDALVWTSLAATKRAHFKLQIASDSGFSSGLSTYYSYANSGFEYWDGSAWQTLGNAGMPSNKTGNNVRYTATSGLTGTKYRRVAQTD